MVALATNSDESTMREQSFRVAHSSSSTSSNVTARRQHAFRLPSASTPPATRSESKTSIAAHAQASCCSHLAERCWFAQTKAAASAQHVDGTTPLLDSGLERTQSESRIEQRQPSCDMRGQQPRLRSVFATILAIANTPTVSSCNLHVLRPLALRLRTLRCFVCSVKTAKARIKAF